MNKNILIIEDDETISLGLKKALSAEGYQVTCAFDGEDGVYLANTELPNLIILDIMMPFMNGFEVIAELRRDGNQVPIIVLSARVETQDKVRGLKLGADDYMEKPFSIDELLARVQRKLDIGRSKNLTFGDFNYNQLTTTLTSISTDTALTLTSKEIKLLDLLIKRDGQIISREKIITSIWGCDYEGTDRTVDNVILGLRKKIGKDHLLTIRGMGYRFMTKL